MARQSAGGPLIGIVVPYDMALDRELWRWTPDEASLLFTRTPYHELPVTVEMAEVVGDAETVARAGGDLRSVSPSAYAYGCTSGSFVRGLAGERELSSALAAAGGAPAVTTSGAILEALEALDAAEVSIATPYDATVTEKLEVFLNEAGIGVCGSQHLGLTGDIWKVPYEETVRLVRAADTPSAQAIVVSCTNLATYDVIAELEAAVGKPVISANQATMWAVLRRVGLAMVGPGQRLGAVTPRG